MKSINLLENSVPIIKYSVIDIAMILLVYFLPTISHLTEIPFYLIDPMRIMILLAFIHTNKLNSLILAITLPLVSHILAMHPIFYKSMIISLGLVLNSLVLILFLNKFKNTFLAFFFSIFISKLFYYSLKYLLISSNLISGELISTPLEIQFLVTLVLSFYGYLIFSKTKGLK